MTTPHDTGYGEPRHQATPEQGDLYLTPQISHTTPIDK
jgi:hypothetical protein